jgi:hypothetical protein
MKIPDFLTLAKAARLAGVSIYVWQKRFNQLQQVHGSLMTSRPGYKKPYVDVERLIRADPDILGKHIITTKDYFNLQDRLEVMDKRITILERLLLHRKMLRLANREDYKSRGRPNDSGMGSNSDKADTPLSD